jgi:protein SCO1/2
MKYLYLTFCFAAVGFLLGGCSGKSDKAKQTETSMDHSAHANMDMGTGEPTEESIYNVSSKWQNRYGNTVNLDSLRGKTQVLAMVYTSCEYACPRILADMKRIRDGLSEKVLQVTNFTIVSIDPERDTAEKLNQFAKENDLNNQQWTLLRGKNGDILELAALLGFKYKRISKTDFTHSNLITVLNSEGEIVYQRNKLTDNPLETIKRINEIVPG